MIIVQDRLVLPAAQLDHVHRLIRDSYLPEAENRGLKFVESLVSPPLKTANAPVTLWLRWQVADPPAWWAMRAQSATPTVAAVWREVDALCGFRERTYMLAGETENLPAGEELASFQVNTRGHRETAQLSLRDDLTAEERNGFEAALDAGAAALPGVRLARLSANMAPEYAAGDYTWDLLYPDAAAAAAARESTVWKQQIVPALAQYCVACQALELETIGAGLRRREIADGVKRTAYFRMLPGRGDLARRFEADLLEMPAHIPEILNWRLSRARSLPWHSAGCEPWTYVWEQEFQSLDDLLGPYMMHPHHWAHIDRWFDPESGVQAVDVDLSHAFCHLAASVISLEAE